MMPTKGEKYMWCVDRLPKDNSEEVNLLIERLTDLEENGFEIRFVDGNRIIYKSRTKTHCSECGKEL